MRLKSEDALDPGVENGGKARFCFFSDMNCSSDLELLSYFIASVMSSLEIESCQVGSWP